MGFDRSSRGLDHERTPIAVGDDKQRFASHQSDLATSRCNARLDARGRIERDAGAVREGQLPLFAEIGLLGFSALRLQQVVAAKAER